MVTILVLSGFRDPHSIRNIWSLPEAASNSGLGGEQSLLLEGLPGLPAAGAGAAAGVLAQGTLPFAPSNLAAGEKRYSALRLCWSVKQMFSVSTGEIKKVFHKPCLIEELLVG